MSTSTSQSDKHIDLRVFTDLKTLLTRGCILLRNVAFELSRVDCVESSQGSRSRA
jgi:hypothetical protein